MDSQARGEVRAAIYHRVSRVDQNVENARDELHAAARARGMDIALDVEETGSGARNDRPGLQRVMEAARRGKVDAVLCWKLDRFGRSALDLLANLRALEDAGVRFVATSQGIDIRPGGDPMSKLLVTMLSAIAEFERSLIVERTRLGLDKARRAGKRLGRPPVGTAPDPAAVEVLRRQGASWGTIAQELGCTVWQARRACEKGLQKTGQLSVENDSAI